MESIKRTVQVTIVKEIEIELTPTVFGNMTEAEFLADFRKGLWPVEGIDDVVKYAARMAAICGGGLTHDGIGLLSADYSTYPRAPDVKFKIVEEEYEEEILPSSNDLTQGEPK